MRVIRSRRSESDESRRTFLSGNTAHDVVVSVIASLLVAVFSFLGTFVATSITNNAQYAREVKKQSVKDAQSAAADAIKLSFDSQSKLRELNNAAGKEGYLWEDFNHHELSQYYTYFEGWRHDMILSYFRIRQYFGKDAADRLVDLDEQLKSKQDYLDEDKSKQELKPKKDQQQEKTGVCGRLMNKTALVQIAEALECQIRMYSASINNPDFRKFMDQDKGRDAPFGIIDMKIDSSKAISKNLEVYDLNTLSFVGVINSRLQAIERESGIPTYEFIKE